MYQFLFFYLSNCHRAPVDESGMIINQIGIHDISEMVEMHATPCAIPLGNSNSNRTCPYVNGMLLCL
jgi:hypothetical protein